MPLNLPGVLVGGHGVGGCGGPGAGGRSKN